jgi:hypothetical protein
MRVKGANISSKMLLEKRKAAVLQRWIGLVFDTYPPDTAMVLKAGGDRFTNPVNYAVTHNLEMVLDGLVLGKEAETLFPYLEEIIKIRAVQDLTPDNAVSFMSLLKRAIISETGRGGKTGQPGQELEDIERRIDLLADACSNIYLDCKGRIERIKSDEQGRMAMNMSRMLERSGRGK